MKFVGFISEIIKSVWTWIGLFMDIIGAIIYKSPDMANKLSFANVVQQYWWIWIVVGTFLIILAAWEAAKKMAMDNKISEKSNHDEENSTTAKESGGGNAAAFRDNYGTFIQAAGTDQKTMSKELTKEFPIIDTDKPAFIEKGILDYSDYKFETATGYVTRNDIPPVNVIFVKVDFSNNPKARTMDNTARNVRAVINYYDGDEHLGAITGR